ncbi:MAG: hypothetical protein JW944_11165 [Deltaproteobacteria bacterium]|nr:hypothetical protein [Deltaproteobacteria bacterium]
MRAFITGAGWVTAGGKGTAGNRDPFDPVGGALPGLDGRLPFANHAFKRYGRLDRFSKLGLMGAAYALHDAGLDEWEEKRDIGIIVSTVLGCLATDIDYYRTVMMKNGILADPNLFTYTLPNSFLGHASMIFGLTGANFVINDRSGSGISSLVSAMDCIFLGESDIVLAGVCDVETPVDFSVLLRPVPGAIFVVVEKSAGNTDRRPYGELEMDKAGSLFFNQREIKDISICVKNCLSKT